MTQDNKNAELYSLKDVPVENRPASKANVKPVKQKWASDDDAGSLLAGILDQTESTAVQEEMKVSARMDRLRRQQQEQEAEEEARRRAQAERMIREEEERRRTAAQKRTDMLRAIEGPSKEELEAKARAEEESRKRAEMEEQLRQAERARMDAERRAAEAAREAKLREQQRLEALANGPAPADKKKGGMGIAMLAAAAVFFFIAVAGAGAAFYFFGMGATEVPDQTFTKTLMQPSPVLTASVEKGFVAIPKPEVEEEEDKGSARGGKRVYRGGGNKGGGNKGGNNSAGGRKFNFGNPLGGGKKGGGIVF